MIKTENVPFQFTAEPRQVNVAGRFPHDNQNVQIQMYDNLMIEPRVIRGNTSSIYYKKKYDPSFVMPSYMPIMHDPRSLKHNQKENIKMKQDERGSFKDASDPTENENLANINSQQNEKRFSTTMNKFQSENKSKPKNLLMSNIVKAEARRRNLLKGGMRRECKEVWVEESLMMQTDILKSVHEIIQTDPLPEKKIPHVEYKFEYGSDFSVQVIEHEIFNFDSEVQPLVNILRSRIVNESLMEINQEQQISKMETIQIDNKMTLAERAANLQRFMKNEKLNNAKEKAKIKNFRNKHELNLITQKKLISRDFVKNYMKIIGEECDDAFRRLSGEVDDKITSVHRHYKEFLYEKVLKELDRFDTCDQLVVGALSTVDRILKGI
jgi:hypothetical protein